MPEKLNPIRVMHAAETVKGGVASVLRQIILANQPATTAVEVLHCLVPREQVVEMSPVDRQFLQTYKRSGRNILSLLRFFFAFTRLMLRERPDVVHLHSTFAGILGRISLLFIRRSIRPRIVYCPHAFSFLMQVDSRAQRMFAFIERILAKWTDSIICVSDYERREAIAHGLSSKLLTVIYNGVADRSMSAKKKLPNKSDCTRLLFVGRFSYQKGIDVLLDAMIKLEGKPYHLTIVGINSYECGIFSERKNITCAGWLDGLELDAAFNNADVLIIPSRWEGLSMSALEAMSYGLPVVASDCCSFPEMIIHGFNGLLFPAEDSATLAEYILSRSAYEWWEMGQNALQYHAKRFTSEKMIESTVRIYHAVVSNNAPPIFNEGY